MNTNLQTLLSLDFDGTQRTEEALFTFEVKPDFEGVHCLFDWQNESEGGEVSLEPLSLYSAIAHTQRVLQIFLEQYFSTKSSALPSNFGKFKLYPIELNFKSPLQIRRKSQVPHSLRILELNENSPDSFEVEFKSTIAQSLLIEARFRGVRA